MIHTPKLGTILPPVVVALLLLAVWEMGGIHQLFGLEPYTLAYPSAIVSAASAGADTIARDTLITVTEAGTGWVFGSLAGLLLAILLLGAPSIRRAMLPVITGFTAMPVIAIAPLMALYFGLGLMSKISVVVLMTLPPMTVSTYKGLSSVEPALEDVLRSFASPPSAFVRKLRIPWSLPYVFTALKFNVTLSLIGAIIGEFFAARQGLGFRMSYALDTFDMPVAWGTMLVAALLGVVWYQVVVLAERAIVPWHASIRKASDDE